MHLHHHDPDDPHALTVGERLLILRRRAGLSARELAEQVRCVPHTVSAWEAGRTVPRDRDLLTVATVLDVDPDLLSPGLRNRCSDDTAAAS